MKRNEDGEVLEDMDGTEVGTSSDMGGAASSWPASDRIDNIGRNGNDGEHYNYDKCVVYGDGDED